MFEQMSNTFFKYLPAFLCAIGAIWVACCVWVGRKKALARETRCTDTVLATIKENREYNYLLFKFSRLEIDYYYHGKVYHTAKAWFGKWDGANCILIHVNPECPEECYLTTLAEKCRKKIQ